MKRFGIITNIWGWTPRGIRQWVSTFAIPYTCHGVEITGEVPRVYRDGRPAPLHVYKRIVRIGFVWFEWGRFTQDYDDGRPTYFDATGTRVVRYPYGRLQAWRTARWLAEIDRENRRRADERAMRDGCS